MEAELMTEHLSESSIGQEVTTWCNKCKRDTRHRVDRVAVGSHAGKPGPCLEHVTQWMTADQIAIEDQRRRDRAQGKLFGDHR